MLEKALHILENDDVVAIPTETVYGLAASIYSEKALRKIFSTKSRPFFDPLIVHVSSIEEAKNLVISWPIAAQLLAEKFWPGPLTFVLEKNHKISDLITSGLTTVALRMPNHELTLELIRKAGIPLAAPSANKFGRTSPTTAKHVYDEFMDENIYIVDGGPCIVGLESTVLSINQRESIVEISLLRAGHVKLSEIKNFLENQNINIKIQDVLDKKSSPGLMKHHYMPKKPLIFFNENENENRNIENLYDLNKLKLEETPSNIEGVIVVKPSTIKTWNELILSVSPQAAARELYSKLRECGNGQEDIILFKKKNYHNGEDWEAILERLTKASTLIF
jgi:L-threonylcarbamoyladenylate synthase